VLEDHRAVVGTAGPVADRQQSLAELLDREILPCLERPGRLLGPFDLPSATVTGKTKLALVWPSIAEGAHAPAALRPLLVGLPNPRPFSLSLGSVPSPNLLAALRDHAQPAFGCPDWTPLAEADLWIVWLDHPLQLTGLLSVLDASGLPLRAMDREGHPRVVVAGPAADRVTALARVYADAVVTGSRTLDAKAWTALANAAAGDSNWSDSLQILGDVAGPLTAPPTPASMLVPEPSGVKPMRGFPELYPGFGVLPGFLHRVPWREHGRVDAFTDHLVVGSGSHALRQRLGLVDTAKLVRAIERSLERETASLCLHFVLGLDGETEADRLAIADFVKVAVAAAPRGARQIVVCLHELVGGGDAAVRATDFEPSRGERARRVVDRMESRRLRVEVAPPGLALMESLLGEGEKRGPLLELVYRAGARHSSAVATTSITVWRTALERLDGATDDSTTPSEQGSDAAGTGLPHALSVDAPASISPSAPRSRGRHQQRTRADRWTRWQALVPRQFDYRIEYSKRGRLRFLGPSELSELLLGACERAQIPVATTGVVQPRPKVSYGPSLTAGISGDREYIDLALERKVDDLGLRIRSELPEQLRLRAVQFMPRCSPSMQLSRVALAEYEAEVGAGFYEQVASREQDIARVRQWSRRIEEGLPPESTASDDPIHQLCAICWNPVSDEEARLEFTLDLRSEGVRCKPREVLSRALAGLSVDPRLVPMRRRRLLVVDDSSGRAQLRTPLEQVVLARRQQRARERTWA